MTDPVAARELAERYLADGLPRRWRHVRSVARRARWAAEKLSLSADLVAAAWLHDVGYAPELAGTGFHPLDGARYLRRVGIDGHVVSLVAYHSCAEIEADVRGLGEVLGAEFKPGDPMLGCPALLTGVVAELRFPCGAGDGNRTRTISLGI